MKHVFNKIPQAVQIYERMIHNMVIENYPNLLRSMTTCDKQDFYKTLPDVVKKKE